MSPKEIHLCASCAQTLRQPMKLREAPAQNAKKEPCFFCGRACYGTRFIAETQNPTKRKE